MTRRNSSSHALTGLQRAILDLMWAKGPATADQVRTGILAKHPLKDSSVRTLLRRLEARGLVTHRLDGKVFVYEAKMPPRTLAAGAVRRLIEGFWAGSAEQFLAGMVDERIVSPEEIQRLAKRVKATKKSVRKER